ncbi:MAG: hypothetical protein JSV86_08955 [Gemmatimonadota bacterium]|nr:MAG: hypothetical protein JSV86_08955 [Gemmatimonadota bacterium]
MNYGQDRYQFPTPEPLEEREERRTTYRANVDGTEIVIRLSGKRCQDTMADVSYETTVEVQVAEHRLRGCGMALH